MRYILKKELDKTNPLHAILRDRGVEDVERYLNVSSKEEHDPMLLENMAAGLQLYKNHLDAGNKIFIQVDSDYDGYASAAMFYNYTKLIYPEANLVWDIHEGKHHGILPSKIDEDIDLVVAPDSSSNDIEEHQILRERGIDVLVLDHHVCDKISNFAIVINNQSSPNYPNKALCGAGVVYKFIQAADKMFEVNYSKQFIDLCGSAIVADMMDLRDYESHYYVKEGLRSIKNSGLLAIVEAQKFSIGDTKKITPTSIAFYIAPLINALIRVGSQDEKRMLFKALIDGDEIIPSTKRGAKGQFETVAEQAARTCTNARSRQNRQIDKTMEELVIKIENNELFKNTIIFLPIEEEEFDSSLTGLIAMKICAKYKRPTIVARKNDEGFWRGSARGLASVDMGGLKDFFESTGFFEYTAGHQEAHGISIHDSKVSKFIDYANNELKDIEFNDNLYEVDYELTGEDNLAAILGSLGEGVSLWGQGIEEPKIIIKNIQIFTPSIAIIGKSNDTTRIETHGITMMKFKDVPFTEEIMKNSPCSITAIGTANINIYGGKTTIQMFIDACEIKNSRYDF